MRPLASGLGQCRRAVRTSCPGFGKAPPPFRIFAPAATFSTLASYDGPAGQDLGEMFDEYQPPRHANQKFIEAGELDELALGRAMPRGVVHAKGLWHRSIHLWVIDPFNESCLLQRRSMHKDTNPGCWDTSVAGHITSGDDSWTTALRESEEEIGLPIRPPERLCKLFTAVSTQAGYTKSHGAFLCNEYVHYMQRVVVACCTCF